MCYIHPCEGCFDSKKRDKDEEFVVELFLALKNGTASPIQHNYCGTLSPLWPGTVTVGLWTCSSLPALQFFTWFRCSMLGVNGERLPGTPFGQK